MSLDLACGAVSGVLVGVREDTVSTDEEDDEVKAHNHPRGRRAPVRHDAIVHHSVPIFSGQDLKSVMKLSSMSSYSFRTNVLTTAFFHMVQ